MRVDGAINKDTELHPLVRWQFQGGLAEDATPRLPVHQRGRCGGQALRHSGRGRRAGGLAAHLCGRHGPAGRGDRGGLARRHRPSDPPVAVSAPPCQAVVITGEALRGAGDGLARLPVPISTPGFDAAPYLTATLCVTRDPEQASRTWAPTAPRSKRPIGSGCAWPRASAAPAATCTGRSTTRAASRCPARSWSAARRSPCSPAG